MFFGFSQGIWDYKYIFIDRKALYVRINRKIIRKYNNSFSFDIFLYNLKKWNIARMVIKLNRIFIPFSEFFIWSDIWIIQCDKILFLQVFHQGFGKKKRKNLMSMNKIIRCTLKKRLNLIRCEQGNTRYNTHDRFWILWNFSTF